MRCMRRGQSLATTSRKRRMEASPLSEEGVGRPSKKFISKNLVFSHSQNVTVHKREIPGVEAVTEIWRFQR